MKTPILLFFFLCSLHLFAQPVVHPPKTSPKQQTRRYFGLHFDFHAVGTDSLLGRNLSERGLDSLLTVVKPDFIQVDCKGHPGVSSYPSKVTNATVAPHIMKDPLAFYRAVTRKHGVGLYLHYSGVYDDAVLAKHPGWAVQKADGTINASKTSVHGPYVDSLLIPQLNELADYGADGVWVDGECWATVLDYSPVALAKFRAETGIQTIPRSDKDTDYGAFVEFASRSFLQYMGHYVDAVHQHRPTFRMASNWAYSSMMPEPINTNVDFLSGDLTPSNSVNSAALEGRVMAAQGQLYRKPWDLMSWSFWYEFNPAQRQGDQKTAVHLMQEAAEIISLGGGFQSYYQQRRDASISRRELPVMAELSRFVRARQPFCEGSVPVPQIAVLYANSTVRAFNQSLFGNGQTQRISGVLTALLDAQFPAEVLSEQHLKGRMNQYSVIVVSQQDSLDPAFRRDLLAYARQGGHLLIVGAQTSRSFAAELGVTPAEIMTAGPRFVLDNGASVVLTGPFLRVRITGADTKAMGQFLQSEAGDPVSGVIATETTFGKGRLTAVYADLSRDYQKHQSAKLRDFIASLVKPLVPPLVEVSGSHLVHVVLNRQRDHLTVSLINTGGRHADPQVFTYDEVPPLTNLTVHIRSAKKPTRIVQQPENRILPVRYAKGIATVTVPKLMVHSVLIVE